MGQVKKALMEAECNGHIHPLHPLFHPFFMQALSALQPARSQPQPAKHTIASADTANPYKPTTIYGLYANGVLIATYLHKDTADYECWVSRMGEEVAMAETPTEYSIPPLPMHTHLPD